MKYIFKSKFSNEATYSKNGEEVEIIEENGIFLKIRFNDGTVETVYSSEIIEKE